MKQSNVSDIINILKNNMMDVIIIKKDIGGGTYSDSSEQLMGVAPSDDFNP